MSEYFEEDIDPEERRDKIILSVIILTIIVSMIVVGTAAYINERIKTPYEQECKENPRLRYATQCANEQECIKKCVRALRES